MAKEFSVALVTAPDPRSARRLAKAALEARLAACVNLVRGIESHYWWANKMTAGREVLMLFKTRTSQLPKLQKLILANHPYDVPEFIGFPLLHGSRSYLAWMSSAVAAQSKSKKRPGVTSKRRSRSSH